MALGHMGYNNAIKSMIGTIGHLIDSIEAWNDVIDRLGDPIKGENRKITQRRQQHVDLVLKAKEKIEEVNILHDEVTKHRTTPDQRVIGFVLHAQKIGVSVEPYGFTEDWALIELYEEKIEWSTFKGNKVYVGTLSPISLSPSHFHLTYTSPLITLPIYHPGLSSS